MRLEIPGSAVKSSKKRSMQRLDKEKHRPLIIIDKAVEPGIYTLVSDIELLHKDRAVRYRIGKKIKENKK